MPKFKFYGVCDRCYKLDDTVWEALEDESDGYRSYLESIVLKTDVKNLTFSHDALAFVEIKEAPEYEGWKLVDVIDGHVWLTIGTDFNDDYYPNFVFEYAPKTKYPEWEKFIRDGEL